MNAGAFEATAILLFGLLPALAAITNGSSGLALAFLVRAHSPILGLYLTKGAGTAFSHVLFPVNEQISVEADASSASDVHITAHLCKLTFGAKTATLTGRKAHELYATMLEAGVPPDSGRGSRENCRTNVRDQSA